VGRMTFGGSQGRIRGPGLKIVAYKFETSFYSKSGSKTNSVPPLNSDGLRGLLMGNRQNSSPRWKKRCSSSAG